MNRSLINLFAFLMALLFAMAPFVMSIEDTERAELIGARALPSVVSTMASLLRWGIFGIIVVFSIFLSANKKNKYKITVPVFLFSGFYLFQFIYAVVDGYDIQRFFLLTLFSLLIPPFIGYVLHFKFQVLRMFVYLIALFLTISLLFNGHIILSGQRFLGFMNNPNAYGISVIFWMVLLLVADRYKLVSRKMYFIVFILLLFTMLFSGSRNAMLGMGIILFIYYRKEFSNFVNIGTVVCVTILISSYFFDFSFISDRLLSFDEAYRDSGREVIWQRAYGAIETNLWWGNGMNANQVIADTGNMHNSYIRFVLNMGLFFTLIALTFYGASVYKSFKNRRVPSVMVGFLVVYALMNFGEDYFVGLGSATFIYLLFIFGFINYFLTKHAPAR